MAYYTCLLLDADNTLLDFDAAERQALTDTLMHYELPYDEAALDTYHSVNRQLWDRLAKGELSKISFSPSDSVSISRLWGFRTTEKAGR